MLPGTIDQFNKKIQRKKDKPTSVHAG